MPWLLLGLGATFLAAGSLPLLATFGVLSGVLSTTATVEAILLGSGLLYVGIALALLWKHARLEPGTKEYEEYHRPKGWHAHLTHASIGYWVGMAPLLAGFGLLGIAEGPDGRCYKGAPDPCLFTLSPSGGLEFWGTALLIVGPSALFVFGAWRFAQWRKARSEDRAVRKWLDGEGPIE